MGLIVTGPGRYFSEEKRDTAHEAAPFEDGVPAEAETCTLEVPGANDTTELYPENTAVVTLQKAVTAGAPFDANVSCTGDGDDDALGQISIVAVKVD